MKIYDTLIIGCSYFSVGYAMNNPNTIICEAHQTCDNNFYLPIRGFDYKPYKPQTSEGEKLLEIFNSRNLLSEKGHNVSAFEGAFCKYIYENNVNVLLKCRVIRTKESNGVYDVTVQSNEGLSHIFARKILNSLSDAPKNLYTALFISTDIEKDKPILLSAFKGSVIKSAVHDRRYAIHIPVTITDENLVKVWVYENWKNANVDAKIIYMSPIIYSSNKSNKVCDDNFISPIQAFEAGYLFKGDNV